MWYFRLKDIGGSKVEAALAKASACWFSDLGTKWNFHRSEEILD
jgi:hypothetical protein